MQKKSNMLEGVPLRFPSITKRLGVGSDPVARLRPATRGATRISTKTGDGANKKTALVVEAVTCAAKRPHRSQPVAIKSAPVARAPVNI